jgi:outer membrane protein OmpU
MNNKLKELIMNKLSKLGVSALCGSLAAISAANAGDLTATGGATVTWLSEEGAVTGNPIGMASAVSFKGSGELDNGWNVALTIGGNDAGAYSASNIVITLPGMGDVRIDQGASGTGIARMDDMTPSVYEEADGAGISAGIDKTLGVNTGTTIEVTPTEAMPAGLTARFAYSKDADGGNVNDKAAGGASNELGSGWDLTLEAGSDLTGVDGLTLYAGMSEYEQYQNASGISGDGSEQVYGVKYATGGFTVGYQVSDEETGETSITGYDNTYYSVTFSVNDDLSIGYNHVESDQAGGTLDAEATSYQAAYTMGGATFSIAEVDIDNRNYAASDINGTVVSMGLAF